MTLEKLNSSLEKCLVPPRVLLSRFRFLDESSRYSRACLDPYYLPFYYHLGRQFPVKNLLEIGFGLGINSACYMIGNEGVDKYLTIQEPFNEYYSTRIGVANIKTVYRKPFDVYVGNFHDEEFLSKLREVKWDLIIINEKKEYDVHLLWMNTVWDNLVEGGMIIQDYINSHGRAYKDFCKLKNRNELIFKTRYGVGGVQK